MTKSNINQQTAQIKRRSGYSSIPNAAMADTSISIEARGLLALLMSFKEGWVFHPRHLMEKCGVGKDKYYRMSGELKDAGYLEISPSHNDDSGRFNGCQWQINDVAEVRETRKPENTDYGKQGTIRETKREVSKQVRKGIGKPIPKNEPNQIVDAWNCMSKQSNLPQCQKLTPSRAKKLKARITDYGTEQIITAISMIPNMSFLMGNGSQGWKASFDFLLQPDSVVRILEGRYEQSQGRETLSQALMREANAIDEPDDIWATPANEILTIEGNVK